MELADGDDLYLRIGPVAKRLGDTTVRMLGYNGSIPGPTVKVRQGWRSSSMSPTRVTWRQPCTGTGCGWRTSTTASRTRPRPPPPIGGSFAYRIWFPDPCLYWYHPHIREDYTQEMGLYGNILVVPADPDYAPARQPGCPADPG